MTASANKGKGSEGSKAKLYTAIGVIIAICCAALIIWDHSFFKPNDGKVTALTVGETSYTVAQADYFYHSMKTQEANVASQMRAYGLEYGYDASLPPQDQMYSKDEGITYHSYFKSESMKNLQRIAILTRMAADEGFTMSEESTAQVEDTMAQIKNQLTMYSVSYGGSKDYYLAQLFGPYASTQLVEDMLTQEALANEYAKYLANQRTYDEAALDAYYQENAADLDSYDYRYCFIPVSPESGTDAEGNPAEPTEEQMAAAETAAAAAAQSMVSRIQNGEAFNTVAADYVDEASKANYEDPDFSLSIDAFGLDMGSSAYGIWLKDPARQDGDVGSVPQEGTGYYVVQLLAREKRDNSYQTVDVGVITLAAQTTETEAEDGTKTTAPTQEQLDAAKAKAEEVLAQWDATANMNSTVADFLALADGISADPAFLSVEAVNNAEASRGTYGQAYSKWAFSPDTQVGASTLLEMGDGYGGVTGYQLFFLNGQGQARWEYNAENTLRNGDFELWYNGVAPEFPIVEAEGADLVGM